ncbi:MAG TPA: hypothetical protein VH640_24410 [Bryobacteraceae bacterium]
MRKWRKMAGREDALLVPPRRKPVPHEFVLDALERRSPRTRPMFGCLAVYIGEKVVVMLRDKPAHPADNGVWVATTAEHHQNLRAEFPRLRSIQVLGKPETHWQVLPADAPDFEEAALRLCELIVAGDPRIGRVPKRRSGAPRG